MRVKGIEKLEYACYNTIRLLINNQTHNDNLFADEGAVSPLCDVIKKLYSFIEFYHFFRIKSTIRLLKSENFYGRREKMSYSENIRNLREKYGYSQAELGRYAGVSQQAVDRMERGIMVPNAFTAIEIARKLNTTVEELICGQTTAKQTDTDGKENEE